MISIQKKFLFIHVPKTGGNSLQNILRDYSEDEIVTTGKRQDGIERFGVRNTKYKTKKHSPLSHYKSALDHITYKSLFKFATIRNPWDRLISYYFSPHRSVAKWDKNDFLQFLDSVPPLRNFICEHPEQDEKIKDNTLNKDLDYLIRFESLEEDFKSVCKQLEIPCPKLPKRNSSTRGHYSNYYDKELVEVVGKKFHEEIAIGNYKFEQE